MKKIFVLYTGGTIGMTQSPQGLRPDTTIVHRALAPYSNDLSFSWHIHQPLIDSSALNPQHWADWLPILRTALTEYDGVLILHGTDTLAYTANLLALTLDTHGKPVILTGSQHPFDTLGSDAPNNLHTAVSALQRSDIHEVLLAFYGKLFPAVGSSKISTERNDGFDNPHFGTWQPEKSPIPFSGCLERDFNTKIRVTPILLTPSNMLAQAATLLNPEHTDAAVILSFGHGNAPAAPELLAAIRAFAQTGHPILNISQVPQGYAAAVYAQGDALRQSGAINGGKCNLETATVLLSLAAHNRWTADNIRTELRRLQLLADA